MFKMHPCIHIRTYMVSMILLVCVQSAFGSDPKILVSSQQMPFEDDKQMLQRADDCFTAGLYTSAADLYQRVMDDPFAGDDLSQGDQSANKAPNVDPLDVKMYAKFQLAHTHFTLKKYPEALSLLLSMIDEAKDKELRPVQANALYLSALVYKEMKAFDQALKQIERYLALDFQQLEGKHLQQEAQFEAGLIYDLQGEKNKAIAHLESLHFDAGHQRLSHLREIVIARIHLIQKETGLVVARLTDLAKQLENQDLSYEVSYLLGEAFFRMRDFAKAAAYFEQTLPKELKKACSWYGPALYYLGWSYLNLADVPLIEASVQLSYFNQAEAAFKALIRDQPEERGYLALGQYYLIRGKHFQDLSFYRLAEDLLSQQERFTSLEAKTQGLLLLAAAAPSYLARKFLYEQIIDLKNKESPFYAKGWFFYALNEFEEGQALLKSGQSQMGKDALKKAITAFEKAFELLKQSDNVRAVAAIKYLAIALGQSDESALALEKIDHVMLEPKLLESAADRDEIDYLQGFFALQLAEMSAPHRALEHLRQGERSLQRAASAPSNKFGDIALGHLAAWYYRHAHYQEAEKIYLQLIERFPNSPLLPDAWGFAACCAELLQKDPSIAASRRRYVLEHYPKSNAAIQASFNLYSYADYLQGGRPAFKHLQHFVKEYPHTPYVIQAHYLIGLDFKRNRKTQEGKWIRKKSLTDAIDAFQAAEAAFDHLMRENGIPKESVDFYTKITHRAILERAMANLKIAEESAGAKQQIYLEYAEEVFQDFMQDLKAKAHYANNSRDSLYDEAAFGLAKTYIKGNKDEKARHLLLDMAKGYQDNGGAKGYYPSRVAYELGALSLREQDDQKALHYLNQAEALNEGGCLNTEEKLDLWIQQSYCYRNLKQFDDATLILSKVANDDAVSSLRLKAMYLRADIYELQERPELARKQLESLAKKGGIWALKAKERLESTYGY